MTDVLGFGSIGLRELLLILLVAILIFGSARIPQIARSLGKGIREFKKAGREITRDIEETTEDESKGD